MNNNDFAFRSPSRLTATTALDPRFVSWMETLSRLQTAGIPGVTDLLGFIMDLLASMGSGGTSSGYDPGPLGPWPSGPTAPGEVVMRETQYNPSPAGPERRGTQTRPGAHQVETPSLYQGFADPYGSGGLGPINWFTDRALAMNVADFTLDFDAGTFQSY
jgi:hypothetical protein